MQQLFCMHVVGLFGSMCTYIPMFGFQYINDTNDMVTQVYVMLNNALFCSHHAIILTSFLPLRLESVTIVIFHLELGVALNLVHDDDEHGNETQNREQVQSFDGRRVAGH